MDEPKPVYSSPSDENEDPRTETKNYLGSETRGNQQKGSAKHRHTRARRRKGARDVSTPATAVNGPDGIGPLHEGDAVVKRHPTANNRNDGLDHRDRNRRAHQREKRRIRDLRAENEKLHRRLAAIYDALTLD